jgi:hypothetical protein
MLVAVNHFVFPSAGWSVAVPGWSLLSVAHSTSLSFSLALTMAVSMSPPTLPATPTSWLTWRISLTTSTSVDTLTCHESRGKPNSACHLSLNCEYWYVPVTRTSGVTSEEFRSVPVPYILVPKTGETPEPGVPVPCSGLFHRGNTKTMSNFRKKT